MRFSIYQDTKIGGRTVNQDRMGYCFTSDSLLMLVADGMGGHVRGEVAAQITLQTAASVFQQVARPALPDPAAFLDEALRRSHREILRYQKQAGLPESPRTTVVACVVQGGRAWWAHAGDSRLYWFRGDRCLARTQDHSKVQNLVNLGLLQPEEQETHPERNKVLNCLGSPFEPTIELGGAPDLHPGDAFLLCSDGVWAAFSERELCGMLYGVPVKDAVPRIVQRATLLQGPQADNATALGMSWVGAHAAGDGLSSGDVPDGAITTTIALGPIDDGSEVEPMSEDEIERTIREIRAAIERTGGNG
ncbi:MAG: serine/threonine-protein phosphatase [Burkholderiaceae bacterium]|nr:serine/threonine-protein phosphatase [Burkholderiaceae bacterium]